MANQRKYNKIYVNKNREDGSEGVSLGYQYDENEIILSKDKDTYFHVPPNAVSIKLADTDLIANGAVAGIFPAASDRVFKNQKGYGNVTPNGNSSTENGMWFCSWLRLNEETNVPQWMDRYYQPGKFDYNKAINQLFDLPEYVVPNGPVFVDVPSSMVFEPGVMYRYFHLGERSATDILTTFEGVDQSRLKMHLLNWGTSKVDRSPNALDVGVQTNADNTSLLYYPAFNDGSRIINSSINFENTYNTSVKVNYNSNYLFENEFTWSFWAYSQDWQTSPSTQLIGNLSTRGGGVGVFIDTLETFPFIAIPETTYGHVLFLNEKGVGYLDKSIQTRSSTVMPICFGIDSNNNVVICNDDVTGMIYKMDHSGNILKTTKNTTDTSTLFTFPLSGERPKQLLCGMDDDFYVVTNLATHQFDVNFNHKGSVSAPCEINSIAAFRYNLSLGTVALEICTNVLDVKFSEQIKWSISLNGDLYKNDALFQTFGNATKFSISPTGELWVVHGINLISIVDPNLAINKSIINQLQIGSDVLDDGKVRKKNISFTKRFDKKTSTNEWNCVIYYTDEKILYFYELTGKLSKITDLSTLFDFSLIQRLSQNIEAVEFLSNGDFTGYERQRIFSKLPPYYNEPQLCIKASTKDTSKLNLVFNCPIKKFTSIKDWEKDSWKHFILTYKNKQLSLFCNNENVGTLSIKGQDVLYFDNQPSFFIGSPTGATFGLNTELGYASNIFNGKIGDIRIYDYAINPSNFNMFQIASTVAQDLIWPLPVPSTQYVEHIERMFKHKLPGFKSQFFKLKLTGTKITDKATRLIVEEEIRDLINESKPAYSDLLQIEWID